MDDYQYQADYSTFTRLPSWLESSSNKHLNLYVTRYLDADQWAQLLDTAKKFSVTLNFYLAPQVKVPAEIAEVVTVDEPHEFTAIETSDDSTLPPSKHSIIQSNNIDETANNIANCPQAKIITVSECNASNILIKFDIKFSGDSLKVTAEESSILESLRASETVILKGKIDAALADHLTSLFTQGYLSINGEKEEFKGKLIIVTDDVTNLGFAPHEIHNIDQHEEKITAEATTIDTDQFKSNDLSAESSEAFAEQRRAVVAEKLSPLPYIVLEGATAT
ncbi:unnamed protein product, partial [marine sediment metagenome]